MIGHIYITGLIGSERDETGKVTQRGVELQDIVSQFQLNKGSELIHVHITSEGGSVDTGKRIAEYLKSFNNVVTIAESLCASIATEIHLSVPIERRKIVAGTRYIIHQPMYSLQRGIALNADQLNDMADDIGETEKEMLSMYSKATGLDKTALGLLMKQETDLTPEQCKEYGFVSEILGAENFKAVALINPKQKNNDMSKFIDELKALSTLVKTAIAGKEIKKLSLKCKKIALDLTTTDGVDVIVDDKLMPGIPSVGEAITLADGSPAEDGKYLFEQGVLVVVGGLITEVLAPEAVPADAEAIKAELADLKAKHEALVAEREAEKAELALLTKDVEAMAKLTSTYKPAALKVAFKKQSDEKVEDESKALRLIREARKNKK